MVQFNFTYGSDITIEQRIGFEMAAQIWGTYLTDDIEVNLHIGATNNLNGGSAVGGAVPILHEQTYGVFREYYEKDITTADGEESSVDQQANNSLQTGNTVDLMVDGELLGGNTEVLLTSAQAKALGMHEALDLGSGKTWDRNLVENGALDGYILVNNDFDWNYDFDRTGEATRGTLDFLSMALHEIGHNLGFISGLDGTVDVETLHSGETRISDFTILDLFRHSLNTATIDNPDGSVSTVTEGEAAYLSIDGGQTNLGDLATGQNGDGDQASHWKRLRNAMGIMDPTLAYTERMSLSERDLKAMDILGWDIDYSQAGESLDLQSLLFQAEAAAAADLGIDHTFLSENRGENNQYTLGYSQWFQLFEDQIIDMGYNQWWQILELGYNSWQQQNDDPDAPTEVGDNQWWQLFEDQLIDMGYNQWWQVFEDQVIDIGYNQWWQVLEVGYSQWWQQLETFFFKIDKVNGNASQKNSKVADGGVRGKNAKVYRGGDDDDIIAGDKKQDRINAGAGDDLIDGKEGHDVIWGKAGNDIIYGQDGNDLIYGGDDDDLLLGENDDDALHGNDGHDIVRGGSGDDIVTGGEGNDDLNGGWGNDVLHGGKGDDQLEGEAASDILIGGEGKDQLSGGSGDDVLYGDAYEGTETLRQLRKQLQTQAQESGESSAGNGTAPVSSGDGPIRVEAESMTLTGGAYLHTSWNNDSGDSVKTAGSSTATTTFSGPSGSYMVVVRYFDEIGGDGKLGFGLNGTSLNSFDLNQETNRYYTRTVAQSLTLKTGDKFTVTATGDGADDAAFDYLEFIPLDNLLATPLEQTSANSISATALPEETVNNSTSTTTEAAFRIEAESMTLVGDYYIETNNSASGGNLIAVRDQGEGKALSTFSGGSGYYNIVVGYYDESGDGVAKISTSLDGRELDTWLLDQSLSGDTVASAQSFTTRTVASTVFLQSGELFELTGLRGEGNEDELARIDYIDFVKVDWVNGGSTEAVVPVEIASGEPVVIGEAIRVEAESMNLNGYYVEYNSNPSNGRLIKTNSRGTAKTQFSGDSGYYNIVVAYYDENDGLATLSASLRGVELEQWQLDQNLGSNFISNGNRVTRTVATQIQVNTNDELKLQGFREYNEFARIDYVEFIPVSAPVMAMAETINDDFLQGGTGNDTVYGGKGNDILYGESQGDNSSSRLKGSRTYNGHTYLLSNSGTWEEAQAEAQRLGGNLATINTAEEESWLRNTFSSTTRLWMGFNDISVEGQFEWVSGEAVTYTNWAAGEPNNDGGGQDYGTINFQDQWDDIYLNGFGGDGFQGIIEISATDNDILIGGSDHDILYGNGGDDELYGDTLGNNPNSALNNGLIGHWTFDETSGQQAGDAAGGNIGTLTNINNPIWQEGIIGGALSFSGGNDHILVADATELDITQTLTLATWIRADSFDDWDGLITKGTNSTAYAMQLWGDGSLRFTANWEVPTDSIGSGSWNSNTKLSTNQWHHVAVTYDSNNVKFYIDGQLDTNVVDVDLRFGTNSEALVLGADLPGGDEFFDGVMDDAQVYNRALSAEEIAQIATSDGEFSASNEGGNDFLYGGVGSDLLEGGAGNDVLYGTDAIAAGYFEKDILGGGLGADTFVLGDTNQSYYQGAGDLDFATVKDFNATEDLIQLHGSASSYRLQQRSNDTYLYRQNSSSELVAVLKNVSVSNLNTGFTFV